MKSLFCRGAVSIDYCCLLFILQHSNFNLTNQIAGTIPSALRRFAEIFLNIFQVSGLASEWLQALVEEEIDGLGNMNTAKKLRYSRRLKSNESNASGSERELLVRDMSKSLAGEANLLFRGNSLLTQALECHMRRLGKDYLEAVLSERIFEINELNPDCEVDPSRIRNHDDMDRHWAQLIIHTSKIWKCIEESVQKLPGELRQILVLPILAMPLRPYYKASLAHPFWSKMAVLPYNLTRSKNTKTCRDTQALFACHQDHLPIQPCYHLLLSLLRPQQASQNQNGQC